MIFPGTEKRIYLKSEIKNRGLYFDLYFSIVLRFIYDAKTWTVIVYINLSPEQNRRRIKPLLRSKTNWLMEV